MIHATTSHRPSTTQHTFRLALLAGLLLTAAPASSEEALTLTASPEGARIYFIGLANGDTVTSPLVVRFGLSGMGVAPAGTTKEKTGHHHLLVDTELVDPALPIPADEQHRHFGGGQTEVSLELPPGPHSLQLVLADYRHVPHDPPVVSERITITVK